MMFLAITGMQKGDPGNWQRLSPTTRRGPIPGLERMGFRGSRVQIPPSRLGNQMPDNRLGGLASCLPDPLPQLLTELFPPARTATRRYVPDGVHDAPERPWPIARRHAMVEGDGACLG
jgi:hypothetical protein